MEKVSTTGQPALRNCCCCYHIMLLVLRYEM